jgi:Aldo/keto reductase family
MVNSMTSNHATIANYNRRHRRYSQKWVKVEPQHSFLVMTVGSFIRYSIACLLWSMKHSIALYLFVSFFPNNTCCSYILRIKPSTRYSQRKKIENEVMVFTKHRLVVSTRMLSSANQDETIRKEQNKQQQNQLHLDQDTTDIGNPSNHTDVIDSTQKWLMDGLKLLESIPNTNSRRFGSVTKSRQSRNSLEKDNQSENQRINDNNSESKSSSVSMFYCPTISTFDTKGTGPLPFGSYVPIDSVSDGKSVCKIQIALSVANCRQHQEYQQDTCSDYENSIRTSVHEYIDSGFTSFQLQQQQYQSTVLQIRRLSQRQVPKATTKVSTTATIHHRQTYYDDYNDTNERCWGYENVYKPWIRDTPLSILDSCHITVPIKMTDFLIPLVVKSDSSNYHTPTDPGLRRQEQLQRMVPSRTEIRSIVMETLQLTGLRSIDDLQLNYNTIDTTRDDINTMMEILDVLFDLQREGYVRLITGHNFPWKLQQHCRKNGFPIHSNQYDSNLLLPTAEEFQSRYESVDLLSSSSSLIDRKLANSPIDDKDIILDYVSWSNPLASGWLTGKFGNDFSIRTEGRRERQRQQTKPNQYVFSNLFTENEQRYWDHILPDWARRYDDKKRQSLTTKEYQPLTTSGTDLWAMYQNELMLPLKEMSHKYGVSASAIVLRWILQQQEDTEKISHFATSNRRRPFSTTIGSRLFDSLPYQQQQKQGYQRIEELRQVFAFKLEEEDLQRLNDINAFPEIIHKRNGGMDDVVDDDKNNNLFRSSSFVQKPGGRLFLPH